MRILVPALLAGVCLGAMLHSLSSGNFAALFVGWLGLIGWLVVMVVVR